MVTCADYKPVVARSPYIFGGSGGINRTFNRIKKYYHFPKMLSKIRDFIKKCKLCQKNKTTQNTKLPMAITTTSSKPLEKIFLDIVGPLPLTTQGNKYILTIQDDLSKYSLAIPLQNQETITIAKAFVEHLICRFGAPTFLLTDQGSNFVSQLFQDVCKLLKIKKLQSTAYHPQTNGALERSHRTFTEYLRNFLDGDQNNWDTWLPYAIFCFNSTPHSATSLMPFEIIHGFLPNIPTSLKTNPTLIYNYEDYITEIKNKLQNSYILAKQNLLKTKEKYKTLYDKNINPKVFKVGDIVFLKNEAKKNKLDPLWNGPYEITEITSEYNSKIKIGRTLKIVNNNRLKLMNV